MKQSNARQALWVLIGSLSAFMFTIVSAVILSRYFDKATYGTYRQVIQVYDVLLITFTLGVPKAYSFFLPRVPIEEAKSLISRINSVLVISGLSLGLFLYACAGPIAGALNNESLEAPLKLFSLVPVFMLPTMGIEGVLATFRRARTLALYNILTRAMMLLLVVLPVIALEGDLEDAMLGFTVASFLTFAIAMSLKYRPVKGVEARKASITYKMIYEFSFPVLIANFWHIVIMSSDRFFISRYFGEEVFAEYANGSLDLPFVSMVASAAALVLAPIYSAKANADSNASRAEMRRLWNSVLSKTVILIYPAVVFFICFADLVMVVMYGEQYSVSGSYFQIRSIVNFFTLVAFGPLILSIGGGKYYGRAHMVCAAAIVGAHAISVHLVASPLAVAWISTVFRILLIIALVRFIAKYFGVSVAELFPIKLITKISLAAAAIAYGVSLLVDNSFPGIGNVPALMFSTAAFSALLFTFARLFGINYLKIARSIVSPR